MKLDAEGPEYKGPPRGAAKTLTAKVDEPLTLTLYATDTGNTISQQDQPATRQSTAARGRAAPQRLRELEAHADAGCRRTAMRQQCRRARCAAAARAAAARGGVTVRWYKHRGPGGDTLKFDPATPMVAADPEVVKMFQKPGANTGKATTTATFTEPGEYWVRAQISDGSRNG